MNQALPRPAGSGSENGFTLFEMLVVMAIVALASAMILPKLAETIPKQQLASAAKSLAATLRYARNQAVTGMRPVMVFLDNENRRVTVAALSSQDDPLRARYQPASAMAAESGRSYSLPEGIRLEILSEDGQSENDDVFSIVFYPAGSSSGLTMRLVNDRDQVLALTVDAIGGEVNIARK